ncbi:hypothetical protein CDAR_67801, partial [Caerostris darwini]
MENIRFKCFVTNIDNIREMENLEKFRQLPGILINIRRLCDSDPSQLVDPMSECNFPSSDPKTTNNDYVLPCLLDPDLVLSSALKNLQCNEVSSSCKDTSEVKLNNQKDIPNASKRNDPQHAKVNDVNLQHSENKASRSDKNQAQQECSLKLSNLYLNNYGAAFAISHHQSLEKIISKMSNRIGRFEKDGRFLR